jgi:predicted subunit of tRNA(5-methylaminomethyl-2-thiouridylate) methyltransferase
MKGCKILKVDGSRAIKVEASKSLERIMNKFENKEFNDYEIDTQYYLREINKEINKIMPSQQQNLFFNED